MDFDRRDANDLTRSPYNSIPESRALEWKELLPTTRDALFALFDWLDAATRTRGSNPKHEQPSTSLLISGDRGFGKTTVLLTAAYACEKGEGYFNGSASADDSDEERSRRQKLQKRLIELPDKVVWLRTLDMEPVPARANLLATLLVCIRDALENRFPAAQAHGRGMPASILEGGVEKPWRKIDRLVRDATFMWEDAFGQNDPRRERAEQQIKAAETLATFQDDFRDAVDLVAQALGHPRRDDSPVLVLPIDHVDRSIDHLFSIVKLLRMASSPRLWFVLAAGREDFQLFLERAFQKELLTAGNIVLDEEGSDQTQAIARQQAAATLRRSLPPSYRIRIASVSAGAAWSFPEMTSGNLTTGSLGRLFKQVDPPPQGSASRSARNRELCSFAELFDFGGRLVPDVGREFRDACRREESSSPERRGNAARERSGEREQDLPSEPSLSFVGKTALRLSARTLRDLRVELQARISQGKGKTAAEDLAAWMLKTAIDESPLPYWASEQLHNRIIRKDAHDNWILDLGGKPVQRAKRTTLFNVFDLTGGTEATSGDRAGIVASELHLRRLLDFNLELRDLHRRHRRVPLPANVGGWLMVLHDLLAQQERVLSPEVTPYEMTPQLVLTRHEFWFGDERVALEFWWSLPVWETFFEFSVFSVQWKAFLHRFEELILARKTRGRDGSPVDLGPLNFRLILAAWVENVCSVAGERCGHWDWEKGLDGLEGVLAASRRSATGDGSRGADPEFEAARYGEALESYEGHVRGQIDRLARAALGGGRDPQQSRRQRALAWLEQSLPLFALPEHAPSSDLTRLFSFGSGEGAGAQSDLLWANRQQRLMSHRQALVRRAAQRTRAYRTLRGPRDKPGDLAASRRWLSELGNAWFAAVDVEAPQRPSEPLRGVTLRFREGLRPSSEHDLGGAPQGLHS